MNCLRGGGEGRQNGKGSVPQLVRRVIWRLRFGYCKLILIDKYTNRGHDLTDGGTWGSDSNSWSWQRTSNRREVAEGVTGLVSFHSNYPSITFFFLIDVGVRVPSP